MKTVCSVSGGQSSAYIAANYNPDILLFALVTINDAKCTPNDKKLVQMVSDKIGREFIATAEDDTILETMFDLEQYTGKTVNWVVGKPFDNLEKNSLPNIMWRHCTREMKLRPMFKFWKSQIGEPVKMQIGFRSGEERRAKKMLERCDENGLIAFGKKPWQKPIFPMIDDGIKRDKVVEFWRGKNVRFAPQNNCVGCFHRNPLVLRKMFDLHPQKMEWFAEMETTKNARWKSEISYKQIKKHRLQHEIDFDDFGCDTGHCGV
jgi:hypothetical protein